jgi:hypothetical protein
LIHDNFDVTAAFWLKTSEEDWWHLYVASTVTDERGPIEAYGTLHTSLRQLSGTTLSVTDVKLIGASNPITVDVLKAQTRYSGSEPIHFDGSYLGGTFVEDALLYPPPRKEDSVSAR